MENMSPSNPAPQATEKPAPSTAAADQAKSAMPPPQQSQTKQEFKKPLQKKTAGMYRYGMPHVLHQGELICLCLSLLTINFIHYWSWMDRLSLTTKKKMGMTCFWIL